MSQELHYTSVPRGLKPGSRGFCTVGMSPRMPGLLVERLEALSGYQPVFAPHDPSSLLNPIVFSHLRLTISGKVVSVLSRIGPAGLDYSGRPSKYAHHVVLEGSERPEGGPAWLLSQSGFMHGAWEGEPREIPARQTPQGDRQPGVALAWQALTEDGGWAGVLAETFLANPHRTVFLVFRPGMDVLRLFIEALALLPASRRWDVDFSTYYSQLPQGVTCVWRGILEGSDDAKHAGRLPNTLVLDLCHETGRAKGGALVHLARTGDRIGQEPAAPSSLPGSGRHIPRMPYEAGAPAAIPPGRVIPSKATTTTGGYDLAPELARLVRGGAYSGAPGDEGSSRRRRNRFSVGAALTVVCLLPLLVAVFLFDFGGIRQRLGLKSQSVAEGVKTFEDDKKKVVLTAIQDRPLTDHPITTLEPSSNAVSIHTTENRPPEPAVQLRKEEIAAPEPPKPAPAEPVVMKAKIVEPAVLFFPLPELPKGPTTVFKPAISRSYDQSISAIPKDISEIKTLCMSSRDLHVVSLTKDEMEVRTTGIGGKLRLARMKAEDNGLHFDWLEGAMQENQSTNALRDGILKFASGGQEHYILLRDPNIPGSKAFDLTKRPENVAVRPLLRDDYKARALEFSWADDSALKGTMWKLGIRKWKVVSRLGESERPIVIAEGSADGTPASRLRSEIIEGQVRIEIEILPESSHAIRVLMTFNHDAISSQENKWSKILEELAELKEKKWMSDQEKRKLAELEKQSEQIDNIKTTYKHLMYSKEASLSLVVSLMVDDQSKAVIDVAKFGDFAIPQP
jgi:hypothetical protein